MTRSTEIGGRLMPDLPLVSVVVPSLNRAGFISQTIDSILGQDYPRIECIVVDAQSSDGTLEVLESYGERISWVSRPDRGAFDAINDGWRMSSGTILAWLNADDVWVVPHAVSSAVEFLEQNPNADVVYGDCGGIDIKGNLVWYGPATPWDLHHALMTCDHVIDQPSAFMRRGIIEQVGGLYPAWGHDHELWLRISVMGGKLAPMRAHLANARIWAGNGHMNGGLFVPAKLGLTRRILEDPRLPEDLRRQRRRILSNAYIRCLDFLPRPKDWPLGLTLVARALKESPSNLPHIATQVVVHLAWLLPPLRPWLRKRWGHGITLRPGDDPPTVHITAQNEGASI